MSSEMMGQAINLDSYYSVPDKFAMKVGNGTMVFQETVLNGDRASVSTMGQ